MRGEGSGKRHALAEKTNDNLALLRAVDGDVKVDLVGDLGGLGGGHSDEGSDRGGGGEELHGEAAGSRRGGGLVGSVVATAARTLLAACYSEVQ